MIRKSGSRREAGGYGLCVGVVLALVGAPFLGAAQAAEDCAALAPPEKDETASSRMPPPPEDLAKLLEERQRELDRREAAVRKDEERVRSLRQGLEALLKKQAKQTGKGQPPSGGGSGMAHLSQAFETMSVEEAAQRIEKMNDAVAVDMLSRLKSKTIGQILSAINPAKAARLVEKLAVRQPGGVGEGQAKGVKN